MGNAASSHIGSKLLIEFQSYIVSEFLLLNNFPCKTVHVYFKLINP